MFIKLYVYIETTRPARQNNAGQFNANIEFHTNFHKHYENCKLSD